MIDETNLALCILVSSACNPGNSSSLQFLLVCVRHIFVLCICFVVSCAPKLMVLFRFETCIVYVCNAIFVWAKHWLFYIANNFFFFYKMAGYVLHDARSMFMFHCASWVVVVERSC